MAGIIANTFPRASILLSSGAHLPNFTDFLNQNLTEMAKPHHKVKKANHGKRPANAKARKARRKKIKT